MWSYDDSGMHRATWNNAGVDVTRALWLQSRESIAVRFVT